jgi:hypothetical protein
MNSRNREWLAAKASFIIIFSTTLVIFILPLSKNLYPTGVAQFIDYSVLFSPVGKIVLIGVLVLFSLFYMLEWNMLLTTGLLSCLSLLVITFQESNGIYSRATILTVIPAAQFGAYLIRYFRPDFNVEHYRMQFSVQMVVAGYVLAGISKIQKSGLNWFLEEKGFMIQIYKNFYFLYSDTCNPTYLQKADAIMYVFSVLPALPQFLLLAALILELFCFVVLYQPKLQVAWGIGLLLMHIGIAYLMGIGISVIAFPMVIFFVNPLYRFYRLGEIVVSGIFGH